MSIATLWDAGSPQAPTGFADWGDAISDAVDLRTDQAQWRQTHDETLASNGDFPTISLDGNYQSVYIEFNAAREEAGTDVVYFVSQEGLSAGSYRNFIVSEHATNGKTTETQDHQIRLLRAVRVGISGNVRIIGKRRVLSFATGHDTSESNLELANSVGANLGGDITAFRIHMGGGTFEAGSTIKVWQFF